MVVFKIGIGELLLIVYRLFDIDKANVMLIMWKNHPRKTTVRKTWIFKLPHSWYYIESTFGSTFFLWFTPIHFVLLSYIIIVMVKHLWGFHLYRFRKGVMNSLVTDIVLNILTQFYVLIQDFSNDLYLNITLVLFYTWIYYSESNL